MEITVEETARTSSTLSTTTPTVAVWPSLTSSGTSVKEIVTGYWTTLLLVVAVGWIWMTFPAAVTPLSASNPMDAAWPTLSRVTSDSVKVPTSWSSPVSAMSMKPPVPSEPLDVPPEAPEPPELPALPVLPSLPVALADAPEEPPTVPLTAVTVAENGALMTVPSTARRAAR